MKKILFVIVFALFGFIATAQVKEVRDIHGIPSYEFTLGKYVFTGYSIHGCYKLSCTMREEDEAEMLYYFIHQNREQINEKYSVNIKTIELGKAVKFIDFPPYKTYGGMAVTILIETPDHEKYIQAEKAEKEERVNSLQNIF
jgi:hypothetical protein